ncbi:hypothetical protein [Enterovibrio calviensis]|uniref:hypothetical protein n=1 Tax=Enterovibrio calviensis TaxID=91359 RepID=UPI000486EB09|nr:hypothetical protein [Enterovibrio calviensis]
MKKLLLIIAASGFTSAASFSVLANGASGATEAGPLVTCEYSDGSTNEMPSLLCRYGDGKIVL